MLKEDGPLLERTRRGKRYLGGAIELA